MRPLSVESNGAAATQTDSEVLNCKYVSYVEFPVMFNANITKNVIYKDSPRPWPLRNSDSQARLYGLCSLLRCIACRPRGLLKRAEARKKLRR